MQKKQIIVALIAVVGIGLVFSLPKFLVHNEKDEVSGTETPVAKSDSLSEIGKMMAEKKSVSLQTQFWCFIQNSTNMIVLLNIQGKLQYCSQPRKI